VTEPYRILVTGSRDWTDVTTVWGALAMTVSPDPPDREIVLMHGACPSGADDIADKWGRRYGVTIESHPARDHPTEDFGPWPDCGPRRNAFMVWQRGADICLAFIAPCNNFRCHRTDPHPSHGTANCVKQAERAGIPVRRFPVL
jgi:hypothetical protein